MAYNTVMITGSPSLGIFDVSGNNIGDDGISLCPHINSTLTKLRIVKCGLSVEGIISTVYLLG